MIFPGPLKPREKQSSPWRPIETAPKNRRILVFGSWWGGQPMREPEIAQWCDWRQRWEFVSGCGPCGLRPTHWMPLPAVPEPRFNFDLESLQKALDSGPASPEDMAELDREMTQK